MSRIPARVITEVDERANEHCEACGWPAAGKMDYHHRLPRSRGGGDTAANLILVHHTCHVVSPWAIHQNPARSYRLNHTLRTGANPEETQAIVAIDLQRLRA